MAIDRTALCLSHAVVSCALRNRSSICRGVGIMPAKKQVPMRTPYNVEKSTASVTENPTDPGMYSRNMHSMRAPA